MDLLLSVKNLIVRYRVRDGWLSAVNNINFDISKGEVFALVGESGCGKSTCALAIMRLLFDGSEKIEGSVLFEGKDILSLSENEMEDIRGKYISMIFQNPLDSLNPVYRSGKQVQEAILLDNISRKEAWNRVVDLYNEVKIPDASKRVFSFPHELSGGMRQRVMIAMMLSRNPKLLIADEPTTALDVTIEKQILDIIKALKNKHNASILLITHNLGVVAEIADRVGVMYAGDLVEIGDVFTIFKNPVHPYTKALIRTLPRISKREGCIDTIEGTVPRIVGDYIGCRFSNRCPLSWEKCNEETPAFREIEPGHFMKCHLGVR